MWLFKCDCGGEKITTVSKVRVGDVKSCGCIWRKSRARIDITGQRFGRLTVLDFKDGKWRCRCDCGNITFRKHQELLRAGTPSCGCLITDGILQIKHGGCHTTEYNIYQALKARCYNPNHKAYPRYGGRGIKVCDRWLHSFENFLADMGERPGKEYSIDRIDVNGDYSPENCRWATWKEQANNRRNNVILEHNGISHTLAEWCDILNVGQETAYRRYNQGVDFEKIFSKKSLRTRRFTDEQVRFMRNFQGNYADCKNALGIEMTYGDYHQIIHNKAYKDVI